MNRTKTDRTGTTEAERKKAAATARHFLPVEEAPLDRRLLAEAAERVYEESSPARQQIAEYWRNLSPAERGRLIAAAAAQTGKPVPSPSALLLAVKSDHAAARQFVADVQGIGKGKR